MRLLPSRWIALPSLFAAWLCLSPTAMAQGLSAAVKPAGEPRSLVLAVQNPNTSACGTQVDFADGRSERKRLEPNETWTLTHAYRADGIYPIKVDGALVARGLRTVGPCKGDANLVMRVDATGVALQATDAPAQAAVPAPAPAPVPAPATQTKAPAPTPQPSAEANRQRDLVIFVRKDARNIQFVKSIDGTRRLASGEGLLRQGFSYCLAVFPASYQAISQAPIEEIIRAQVEKAMSTLAGGKAKASETIECVSVNGEQVSLYGVPDLIAVQREAIAVMRLAKSFASYEPMQDIPYEAVESGAEAVLAERKRTEDELSNRAKRLAELAALDSREHVASLSLSYPTSRGALRLCTLNYKGASGAAALGYASRGLSTVSPAYRAKADSLKATMEEQDPFHKAYETVDALYQEIQKQPGNCHIYVDFPKNLKLVMGAIERDQGDAKYELNDLIAAAELRDAWSKRKGHANWAANEFASAIKASAKDVKALGAFGITDKAAFDAALSDMQASRYAEGSSVDTLLAYLADKQAAAGVRGASAVSVKQNRERSERAASEERTAAERRRQAEYAREFPYTARLLCGLSGTQNINIAACFTARHTKSQLELRNGSDYKMLQAWELRQAGQETQEGLVIPLRKTFTLKAQNVADTLLLTLRITDNASGRTVYERSVSEFGVLRANN